MNRSKIRTAIAALAALTTLSTIGVTGVASAATPITDTVAVAPVSGVAYAVNDGRFFTSVEGWALKGGKAANRACQGFANLIMDLEDYRQLSEQAGNKDTAAAREEMMDQVEDEALSAGCVISYT